MRQLARTNTYIALRKVDEMTADLDWINDVGEHSVKYIRRDDLSLVQ